MLLLLLVTAALKVDMLDIKIVTVDDVGIVGIRKEETYEGANVNHAEKHSVKARSLLGE